ncbi:probable G-protein coupled receptor 139 [Rhincodon typus]|uniref:probable G-protein coupled receptor 139 n=1 Tax=Rhincodon typus TaxID=259920 RepID=UPI00202E1B59|nr:probable G-protein coupled receptor 139 [Rhincodon typus]
MAVTDLLVIITAVLLNRIPGIYFPSSFLSITPVCSLMISLIYASRDCSVWLTVVFTVDRFVVICCPRLKRKYCTEKMAIIIIGTVCTAGCLKSIPWYFLHEPIYIMNNIPWHCKMKEIFYTSPVWGAFLWIDCIVTPCLPFFLIILLNALTVRFILAANRNHRRLRAQIIRENQNDTELENRRKSIILLFAVSGSFILLWMTYVVYYFHRLLFPHYLINGFSDPQFILQESANMLQLLSCCTNTFIYVVTQSKFRQELKNMVEYPLNLLPKLSR